MLIGDFKCHANQVEQLVKNWSFIQLCFMIPSYLFSSCSLPAYSEAGVVSQWAASIGECLADHILCCVSIPGAAAGAGVCVWCVWLLPVWL